MPKEIDWEYQPGFLKSTFPCLHFLSHTPYTAPWKLLSFLAPGSASPANCSHPELGCSCSFAGSRLFSSLLWVYTSSPPLRFYPPSVPNLHHKSLSQEISPSKGGLLFQRVKGRGKKRCGVDRNIGWCQQAFLKARWGKVVAKYMISSCTVLIDWWWGAKGRGTGGNMINPCALGGLESLEHGDHVLMVIK